jgi:hypothetical protein
MLIPNVLELDYKCQSQDTERLEMSISHVNFDIELQISTARHGMISHVNSDEYDIFKNINLGITRRLEIPIS